MVFDLNIIFNGLMKYIKIFNYVYIIMCISIYYIVIYAIDSIIFEDVIKKPLGNKSYLFLLFIGSSYFLRSIFVTVRTFYKNQPTFIYWIHHIILLIYIYNIDE